MHSVNCRRNSDKGPSRKAYSLTRGGRSRMVALIGEALASDVSIYSERIAGLVFVPLMDSKRAKRAISASMDALEHADALLAESLESAGMDPIGMAVVQYYRTVYEVEREAMRRVLEVVK